LSQIIKYIIEGGVDLHLLRTLGREKADPNYKITYLKFSGDTHAVYEYSGVPYSLAWMGRGMVANSPFTLVRT